MLWPIGEIKVAALSSKHIAAYRDQRLKQVSSGTVIKELNHLSHIIETARREWGIQLPENPVKLVRRPPSPKSRNMRLVADEARRQVDAFADARNPFLLPTVVLAIETAMRQGELISLNWKHINLKKRTAFLPDTKNGESRPIPATDHPPVVFQILAGQARISPP